MAYSHLLFFAAQLRRDDAAAVDALRRREWPSPDGVGDVPMANLHVTVLPIVETLQASGLGPTIQALGERLSTLPSLEAFDLCFNDAGSLDLPGHKGRAPFALRVGSGKADIEACKRRLRALVKDEIAAGFAKWKGGDPHMTLAWRLDRLRRTALEAPLVCTVDEIVLIHSHRGEGRYDILGRWTLTPFLLH